MNMCLLTLFRKLLSFLEEFILIDNSYLNVFLTEAEGMDRKGRTERGTRQSYTLAHSFLLTLTSSEVI